MSAIAIRGISATAALCLLLLLAACTTANNNTSSSGSSGSNSNAAAKATPVQPGIGVPVRVGDLDLTITGVRAVDTTQFNQFNSADTAVDVQVTNSRGSSYDFSPDLAMKLVDTNGVAHSPELACADCPNELGATTLVKGGHAQGSVYFKLAGAAPKEIDYQPIASTNKVAIPVKQ